MIAKVLSFACTRRPFYGSRKLVIYLRGLVKVITHNRAQRLMGLLGLVGMAPGPNTSRGKFIQV